MNLIKESLCGGTHFAMVETFGCQQNVNDSQRIEGMLMEMGYTLTDEREKADVIIFNTCAIRENAQARVYGNLGALKHLKAKKPSLVIGICGCMVQQEHMAEKVKMQFPELEVYTQFVSPRWLCRVGDYRSIEEADVVMRQLKSTGDFKEVSIVRSLIKL